MMPVQILSPLSPPTALHQAASQLGQAWAGSHAQELAAVALLRFAGEQRASYKVMCACAMAGHACMCASWQPHTLWLVGSADAGMNKGPVTYMPLRCAWWWDACTAALDERVTEQGS